MIFDLDGALIDDPRLFGSMVELARKLRRGGVATAAHGSNPRFQDVLKAAGVDDLFDVCIDSLEGATRRLGVSPQRAAVVEDTDAGVSAAHDGGFALVIGLDGTGDADTLVRRGADVVLDDLADVAVRAGDKRISDLPDALEAYGQLIGVTSARQSVLFLDYDGTLAPIVSDPPRPSSSTGSRGAETRLRGMPRGGLERPGSRRYPGPGGHTWHLVCRQPRVRVDRARRHISPERRGCCGRGRPAGRSR